jgi:hypothetical protein
MLLARWIVKDFNAFLDHVMVNFSASYPYGLSKTEVVRLSFQAWCAAEAARMNAEEMLVSVPVVAPE